MRHAAAAELLPRRLGRPARRVDGPAREARVAGWVHRRRDHGGLIFIDLRERSGIVQLVFHPETAPEAHRKAHALRSEDVITAAGTVARRAPENVNPNLATGEIELAVSELEILADADTPPFPIDEDTAVDENLRLRHRSLDLRRAPMQEALALRHRVIATIREVLDERDFLEIETPFLTRSTPEGARDFLVPARTQPGSFYALPQSPQLFKQLLMVGGFERYYQIVRCFRDEDARADRLPEFTQLDLEMAFVARGRRARDAGGGDGDGVRARRVRRAAAAVAADDLRRGRGRGSAPTVPTRASGSSSRTSATRWRSTEFKVFAGALQSGGVVRGINAGARELPRSELDALTELAKQHGAKGLVWAFVQEGDDEPRGARRSPSSSAREEIAAINRRLDAGPGDLLLIVADTPGTAAQALGALRLELAAPLRPDPARERTTSAGSSSSRCSPGTPTSERWDAEHHPFTAPATAAGAPATVADMDDPATLLSRSYDLVLDGNEIGGGSIRNHRLDVQQRVFELIGIDAEEAQARFGFLLDALRYGAPPHGGIAMRHRPDRRAAGRARQHPRGDRLPQGDQRWRPADRSAGPGRAGAAARAGAATGLMLSPGPWTRWPSSTT